MILQWEPLKGIYEAPDRFYIEPFFFFFLSRCVPTFTEHIYTKQNKMYLMLYSCYIYLEYIFK